MKAAKILTEKCRDGGGGGGEGCFCLLYIIMWAAEAPAEAAQANNTEGDFNSRAQDEGRARREEPGAKRWRHGSRSGAAPKAGATHGSRSRQGERTGDDKKPCRNETTMKRGRTTQKRAGELRPRARRRAKRSGGDEPARRGIATRNPRPLRATTPRRGRRSRIFPGGRAGRP